MKTCSQVFQALRIELNHEFDHLTTTLQKLETLANKQSIIAIITFHSLEDKRVKNFVKQSSILQLHPKSVIKPSKEERTQNPRSRSAKCRIIRHVAYSPSS